MAISEDVSSELGDRIATLNIGYTQEISPEDLNGTTLTAAFLANCNALLQELQRCDITVKVPKKCSTVEQVCYERIAGKIYSWKCPDFSLPMQIYATLQNRLPYFPSTTEHVKYKLLLFLVAEVQVLELDHFERPTASFTTLTVHSLLLIRAG